MAEPVLITGCASGDFQSLDGVFLARLQPLRDGTLDAPAPTAIIIFHNNEIREIILQRTCHALRCAVRNDEFLRDLLKTDAQTPRGGELRSEASRAGKECVSTCRSRWSQYH